MVQSGSAWKEYVDKLSKRAESSGCKLDEPVYTNYCGYCKLSATIRRGDGREYATITADDIDDLNSKVEKALTDAV